MNLALKDIGHNSFKFFSSSVGVGLLLMVVFAIGGIIRGVILDSTAIIEGTGADLWVTEKSTLGPLVEISKIPEEYQDAIEVIPGVAEVSPLVMAWDHLARPFHPTPLMKFMYMNTVIGTKTMMKPGWLNLPKNQRFVVIGYEPGRIGGPPASAIVAGRTIEAGNYDNYEMVADVKTGFSLGETIHIARNDYTVVGLTKGMVAFTADPVVYVTLDNAQQILFESDPDLLRYQRKRLQQKVADISPLSPRLKAALDERAASIANQYIIANAIAVKLEPGASAEKVATEIERWQHLEVYTSARENNLQLMGSNRLILFQLSLFRLLLVLITGIIIGLIIYTFTLDKIKEIGILKLLGMQSRRLYSMILQQAILMGLLGTLLGGILAIAVQDYFPRRVVVTYSDIGQMLIIMGIVAAIASILAVRRATKVDARSVLG